MHKQAASNTYGPVGVMVQLTIDSLLEADVIDAQIQFAEAAAQFPGHIKSDSRIVLSGQQNMTSLIAMHSFDSAEHLIRWLESDRRRALMQTFDRRFKGRVEVHYPHAPEGFSSWFAEGETPQKHTFVLRGKTNLLVLTALYPLTLLLPPLLRSVMPGLSRPTITLFTAIIAVSLLGFILVPSLSHRMRYWLNSCRIRTTILGAATLAIFIATVWQIARIVAP